MVILRNHPRVAMQRYKKVMRGGDETMNKGLKTTLKVLVPLVFGVLILWLLYRNMDVETLLETLRGDANFGIIIFASLFGTLGNTFRGFRWHLLNKRLDPNVRAVNSLLTTHGNYVVNMALPRLGEVWRVGAMSHYSGISISKLVGTLFIDRIYDVVAVSVLILLGLVLNTPFFTSFFDNNPDALLKLQGVMRSPWLYIVLLLLVVLVLVAMRWVRKSERTMHSFRNVREGLRTIRTMDKKWLFHLYTVGIWASYFLQFYITFYAFSFTSNLGPAVGLLTFVMGSVAIVAPVQGGMGAWHFMVIYSLMAFGVETSNAQNFALIVHTFQVFIWTNMVGLIALGLLPLVNRHTKIDNK